MEFFQGRNLIKKRLQLGKAEATKIIKLKFSFDSIQSILYLLKD